MAGKKGPRDSLVWIEYGLHLTNRQPSVPPSGLAWQVTISTTAILPLKTERHDCGHGRHNN